MENGTFELLRLTRLSGGQIFWGKLLPSLPPAVLPMLALVPAYAALCFIDHAYIPNLLQILPVVLLAVVMMAILGLTCSAWSRNTALGDSRGISDCIVHRGVADAGVVGQ